MIYFQSQVDKLLKAKDEQIEALQKVNTFLTDMLDIERKRANNAVDQIVQRAGGRTILPPPPTPPDRFEELIDKASRGLALVGGEMGEEEAEGGK